jgi:glutamate-1-semialdehyde aminotransferase
MTTLTARTSPSTPIIAESDRLYARALGLIPAGTQTLAKGPGQYVRGLAPKYLRRAKGARVWDVDGNEYTDWSMAIGPVILGYAHPAVDEAIRRQLNDGITFSLMHPLEVEVAETLRRLLPHAQSVRFGKSGAEATSAAVRAARAFTRRDKVLCCGYHGWHDWYIGVTPRRHGVPDAVRELTSAFPFNDAEALASKLDDDTACVILEPASSEEPRAGFLEDVRRLCDENGTLLIFDEMWTGFRLALGGAQQRFGVTPDLATYSKAIANGMPLSALVGRRDVMSVFERDAFFFSTFGGEALSLAAAVACIHELEASAVPVQLAAEGRRIRQRYDEITAGCGLSGFTRCAGMDCRTIVTFDPRLGDSLLMKSFIQQELIRRGILWAGTHTLSAAHGRSEVDALLEAYEEVLPMLAAAIATNSVRERLIGAPIEPIFKPSVGLDHQEQDR